MQFQKNTRFFHLLGWVGYYIILIIFYSSVFNFDVAFYKATQTVFIHLLLFYTNTLLLMPLFLDKKKIALYFILVISLIIFTVVIIHYINTYLKPLLDLPVNIRPTNRFQDINISHNINREKFRTVKLTGQLLRYFSSSVAIILLSIVYKMLIDKIMKKKRDISLRNEYLNSEMRFLKSQINPHFLFNSLNNIFTLVEIKDDKAAGMLMKLSNMLRHMLYECNEELVPVKTELNYIKDYLELQQLKTRFRQNIKAEFNVTNSETKIPSLILIPFIENSFKHSNIENIDEGWITMQLNLTNNKFHFIISNSISSNTIFKDSIGGIGLDNVKKRLKLLYAEKSNIEIIKSDNNFTVTLKIDLNED